VDSKKSKDARGKERTAGTPIGWKAKRRKGPDLPSKRKPLWYTFRGAKGKKGTGRVVLQRSFGRGGKSVQMGGGEKQKPAHEGDFRGEGGKSGKRNGRKVYSI